jgi:hypothetical protein
VLVALIPGKKELPIMPKIPQVYASLMIEFFIVGFAPVAAGIREGRWSGYG